MKRGEIWTSLGRRLCGQTAAAVIVQDDRFDANDSIIVCPLTTDPTAAPIFRLPIQPLIWFQLPNVWLTKPSLA